MKKVDRATLTCPRCGTEFDVRVTEAARRKFCGFMCRNQSQIAAARASKIQNARSRRLQVVSQPAEHRMIAVDALRVTLVSIEDFDLLNDEIWRVNDRGYAINDRPPHRMHRRIMQRVLGRPLGWREQVDHLNGNRLDNRRENLRLATNRENSYNQGFRGGTSRYKGVYWNRDVSKWQVTITPDRKKIHVGFFDEEDEAANRYDQYAVQLFGEYARLNFAYA